MKQGDGKKKQLVQQNGSLVQDRSKTFSVSAPIWVSLLLCPFVLWLIVSVVMFTCPAAAESDAKDDSGYHLIEGVYYLIYQNRPDQAAPFFQKAIELDPSHPDAYYFLGVSHYRLGRSVDVVLSHLREAEKRGVHYDQLRPNLIPEIEGTSPDSAKPSASREAQIIVEGGIERNGKVVIQNENETTGHSLGEQIPLEGGMRHTIRIKKRGLGQFLKPLAVVGAIIGIWALR